MKTLVVYHMFPHYRAAVIRALLSSSRHEYYFMGWEGEEEGILPVKREVFLGRFVPAGYSVWKGLYFQWRAVSAALFGDYGCYIFLGNPNFVTTWIAAAVARLRGKFVLFWAHGWLRDDERRFKGYVRRRFFGIGHKVMVYNDRAVQIAVSTGFPGEKLCAIYNSLDLDRMDEVYESICLAGGLEARNVYDGRFRDDSLPVVVCVARLTRKCEFDLLLRAIALLRRRGVAVNVALIGDGPERKNLEVLSRELDLDVYFHGSSYDESELGRFIYSSSVAVSPGKVGLTAMHCLSYGTPVITHDTFNEQMPEFEAIEPGITGAFFQKGRVDDLADVLGSWLATSRDRDAVRVACRSVIAQRWNASNQVALIERCMAELSDEG